MLLQSDILRDFESRDKKYEEDLIRYDCENQLRRVFDMYSLNAKLSFIASSQLSVVFEVELEMGTSLRVFTTMAKDIRFYTGMEFNVFLADGKQNKVRIVFERVDRNPVSLKEIIDTPEFQSSAPLAIAAGRKKTGEPLIIDLDDVPNLFIYGSTGSGKSVFIDDIILSLLFKNEPEDLRLVLVDVKGVDLRFYNGIPHMHCPAIGERAEAVKVLADVLGEIERRNSLFVQHKVRSLEAYNALPGVEKLPKIVFIIDEYYSLTTIPFSGEVLSDDESINYKDEIKDIEMLVASIASRGRACGVRMVIATQVLSRADVGAEIQANFHMYVRFSAYGHPVNPKAYKKDLKNTHHKLLGSGDMLVERVMGMKNEKISTAHAQACYVDPGDVENVVRNINSLFKDEGGKNGKN